MKTQPIRPRILGVAQVAQGVRDLATSLEFYRGNLGFEAPYSFSRPDGTPRAVLVKIDNHQTVQLVQEATVNSRQLVHIGFETDDAEGMRAYLKTRGVMVPDRVRPGQLTACFFAVEDPAGTRIEFMQLRPQCWTERDLGKFLPPTRFAAHLGTVSVQIRDPSPLASFYVDVLGFTEVVRETVAGRLQKLEIRVPDGTDVVEFGLGDPSPVGSSAPKMRALTFAPAGTAAVDAGPGRGRAPGLTASDRITDPEGVAIGRNESAPVRQTAVAAPGIGVTRRAFVGALPFLSTALVRAMTDVPGSHRNIRWALSLGLWSYYPQVPFTDILDVMKDTGFEGIRLTGYPGFLAQYRLTPVVLERELAKRNLYVASCSWSGRLQEPAGREDDLRSARQAMEFLARFGANHLVVFSPFRDRPGAATEAGFRELCARCNQVGELAKELGFTAGLHNHMYQMVEGPAEIDRFMAGTNPALFGLSPDTAHLCLAGCDVVATLERYKDRIRFLDYKDARWTTPAREVLGTGGKMVAKDTREARFLSSIYDLGDAQVDFPGCHRVLESVRYRGWICVDLDTARAGPRTSFHRSRQYIRERLEPIYS